MGTRPAAWQAPLPLWWPGSKVCILESDWAAPFLTLLVGAVRQERGREMVDALPHLPQEAVMEHQDSPREGFTGTMTYPRARPLCSTHSLVLNVCQQQHPCISSVLCSTLNEVTILNKHISPSAFFFQVQQTGARVDTKIRYVSALEVAQGTLLKRS